MSTYVYKEVRRGQTVWMAEARYEGRRARKSFTTRHDAKQAAQKIEQELIETVAREQAPSCPTVEKFLTTFVEHSKAKRDANATTVTQERIYRRHLIPVIGSTRLDEVNDVAVQKVRASMIHLSPASVNAATTTLVKALKLARALGYIRMVPRVGRVKAQAPVKDFWEQGDYERLVAAAGRVGPLCLATVLLAGDAGLRTGEIVALRWEDVDFKHRRITVQWNECWKVEGATKSKKCRVVPMTMRLAEALQAIRHLKGPRVLYRDDRDGAGPPSRFTSRAVAWMVARAEAKAGFPRRAQVHKLRHTFCTHLAMRNAPPRVIQALAGHSSISTTLGYMHLTEGALEAAVRLLEQGVSEPAVLPTTLPTNATDAQKTA